MLDLDTLVTQAENDFLAATTVNALEIAKAKYLGRNGLIAGQMQNLAKLDKTARPQAGAGINRAKVAIENALKERREALLHASQAACLAQDAIDVSLPSRQRPRGGLHPITKSLQRIETLFHSLGFMSIEGPEIEFNFYNFTALNIPEHHPARAMHDTFYVLTEDDNERVLRTHTSPMQVRYMESANHRKQSPPFKIIAPGRVYRVDSDATHSPMFHQVEGLWVDKAVSFANLKGLMQQFLQHFFEDTSLEVRFRPSFFPFTEPSAEVDMRWQGGWLEIGGCGMVHPQVLHHVHLDSELYRGLAFGLGVERLTMLRYGVTDLRNFFQHDLRFLTQFR